MVSEEEKKMPRSSFNVDKSSESTSEIKIKIRKRDLERCMKEYGLPEEDFEFEDEEMIEIYQERIMKSLEEYHDYRILDLV